MFTKHAFIVMCLKLKAQIAIFIPIDVVLFIFLYAYKYYSSSKQICIAYSSVVAMITIVGDIGNAVILYDRIHTIVGLTSEELTLFIKFSTR